MQTFGIVGNISRDRTIYSDGRQFDFIGGAAFHIALAATKAGSRPAPISVIGTDMSWLIHDSRVAQLDLSHVRIVAGPSCAFEITYDHELKVRGITSHYGVSCNLTAHALAILGLHGHYHVCCRRPLQVRPVLDLLINQSLSFSIDFFVTSARRMMVDALPALTVASLIFVNMQEFELLASLVDPALIQGVVVFDGPRAVRLLRYGRLVAEAVPNLTSPIEITGAGDVLTGHFLAGSLEADDESNLQRAVQAASTWIEDERSHIVD